MSTYEFTEDDLKVIANIRAAVADRGEDWTYPERSVENADWYINMDFENPQNLGGTCKYVLDDGTPACIVGDALVRSGADPKQLMKNADAIEITNALRRDGILNISPKVSVAIYLAQCEQDVGKNWGVALAKFEQELDTRSKEQVG